jgi:hypothetical protein
MDGGGGRAIGSVTAAVRHSWTNGGRMVSLQSSSASADVEEVRFVRHDVAACL